MSCQEDREEICWCQREGREKERKLQDDSRILRSVGSVLGPVASEQKRETTRTATAHRVCSRSAGTSGSSTSLSTAGIWSELGKELAFSIYQREQESFKVFISYKRVGGLKFLRIGKLQLSWCIVKKRTVAKEAMQETQGWYANRVLAKMSDPAYIIYQ